MLERARAILEKLEDEGESVRDALVESSAERQPQQQLALFELPKDQIVREIGKLDLEAMTPLQAMQKLSEWKDELAD